MVCCKVPSISDYDTANSSITHGVDGGFLFFYFLKYYLDMNFPSLFSFEKKKDLQMFK